MIPLMVLLQAQHGIIKRERQSGEATFMRNPKYSYCAFFTGIDLREMYRNCHKRVRRVHMHMSIQCTNIVKIMAIILLSKNSG